MTNTAIEAAEESRANVPEVSVNRNNAEGWIALGCAMICLCVADGKYNMALASWLVPAFLLRFVRSQPVFRGLAVSYVVLVVMRGFLFRDIIPIPGVFYLVFLLFSGVTGMLPYALDRLLAKRLSPGVRTLLFPTVLVSMQFLSSFGPFGSWGSVAYTQSGDLALLQLLSVTGLWGITFLIGWFATSANRAWELRSMRGLVGFALVYAAVITFGEARLAIDPPSGKTVRVASLSAAPSAPKPPDAITNDLAANRATDEQLHEFAHAAAATDAELLDRTEREARAGAKIIFWAEENAYLLRADEAAFLEHAASIAQRYGVYIGAAMATWTPGNKKPLQNKIVLIQPSGKIAWQYLKARLTPGPEAAAAEPSDGRLKALDTPYGRITAAICFDADFPRVMAQAGALNADIVLVAANDWRAIDPQHTNIASYRPVEQGFNMVRQGSHGLSAAYDRQGRRLSAMDGYQATDLTLVSQVPIHGRRTVYSYVGDWFPAVCVVTLLILFLGMFKGTRIPPIASLMAPSSRRFRRRRELVSTACRSTRK